MKGSAISSTSAPDVDGWPLAFPFCQSCWLGKCFIHEAQGIKEYQRFKNILRNSSRCQASYQEALSKEAEVLHQPNWAVDPLQRLGAVPVVLESLHSPRLVFLIDWHAPPQVREVGVLPMAQVPWVSPGIHANPIQRIIVVLELLPAHALRFGIFPLDWQLPEPRESFKWQYVALA